MRTIAESRRVDRETRVQVRAGDCPDLALKARIDAFRRRIFRGGVFAREAQLHIPLIENHLNIF